MLIVVMTFLNQSECGYAIWIKIQRILNYLQSIK